MGHLADFACRRCHYEEHDIAIGHGRHATPFLVLFSCPSCHSIGSNWIGDGGTLRCGFCYNDAVTMLADDATAVTCPKCQEPGRLTHRPAETWE